MLFLFTLYGPALEGPFLFDDVYLPFSLQEAPQLPFRAWLGVRPLLMATYWLNYKAAGTAPLTYHLVGVFLHALTSALAGLITRKLLLKTESSARVANLLGAFAGGVFLLHPVQTEAVAYVAGRSETLSVFFYFSSLVVFLYRPRPSIGWKYALLVVCLFGAGVLSKEHVVTLPAIALLIDWLVEQPGGMTAVRGNWRLYGMLSAAAVTGAVVIAKVVLGNSKSAGFQLKEFTWYQYLFTQFKVIWVYVKLYVLPFGLNGDYDFPISRSIADPGSLLGLTALALAVGMAWRYRVRFPLACLGLLAFLVMLAPTSSILPIADPIAERRMYLPMLGLLLVTVEVLRRVRMSNVRLISGMAAVLALFGYLSYERNILWGNPLLFWQDVVDKSPGKWRAHFQYGYQLYAASRCREAIREYELGTGIDANDNRIWINLGLAYDCAGDLPAAVRSLERSNRIKAESYTYCLLGGIYGRRNETDKAMKALDEGAKINPNYDLIHAYRGNILAASGKLPEAQAEFRNALALNPENQVALQGLMLFEQQRSTAPPAAARDAQ